MVFENPLSKPVKLLLGSTHLLEISGCQFKLSNLYNDIKFKAEIPWIIRIRTAIVLFGVFLKEPEYFRMDIVIREREPADLPIDCWYVLRMKPSSRRFIRDSMLDNKKLKRR